MLDRKKVIKKLLDNLHNMVIISVQLGLQMGGLEWGRNEMLNKP